MPNDPRFEDAFDDEYAYQRATENLKIAKSTQGENHKTSNSIQANDLKNIVIGSFKPPVREHLNSDDSVDEDSDDDYYDDGRDESVQFGVNASVRHFQPVQKNLNQYDDYFCDMDNPYRGPAKLSDRVLNSLTESNRRIDDTRFRLKDKEDRATFDDVLDQKVFESLLKWRNSILQKVDGCISSGKEAKVYHCVSINDEDLVVKVYRTSKLSFQDRKRYVEGEFRFRRNGYTNTTSRRMVRQWAEKEMRNLKRMYTAGLPVPEPLRLHDNLVLMRFIGKKGFPAPKLKDVNLKLDDARVIYRETVIVMWKIFNKCRLVHADLSEYNMLYLDGSVYIIDVSQSVEHDHPHSLDFLRKDCTNITEFFRKKKVAVMTVKELFDFITDPTINDNNLEQCLDKLSEISAVREDQTAEQQVDEAVFKKLFIPQKLEFVPHLEKDLNMMSLGDGKDIPYATINGLMPDLSGPNLVPEILKDEYPTLVEQSDNDSSNADSENGGKSKFQQSRRPRDETPESKKTRKKAIKEENAERRKKKVKKHEKKAKSKK